MKNIKRAASLLLALVMLLCMAFPCYAVNTETPNQDVNVITITTAKEDEAEGNFEAYQIFRGDISNNLLTNITWGSGVPVDSETGNTTAELIAALKADGTIGVAMTTAIEYANANNLTQAEAVAKAVADFDDDIEKLDAFAAIVAKHLSDTKFKNNGQQITVTGDGYYLLRYVGTPGENDAYTKYILRVADDVEVEEKKSAPVAEKFVDVDKKASNGSVGDKVDFTVKSTVPEMDGYNKYFYIIHDTMSEGLTFNNDVAIKLVKGNDTKQLVGYSNGAQTYDYVVNVDGNTIEIVFHDFLKHKNDAGWEVVTTYSATINENANIGAEGNTNTIYLEYSNNPNYDYVGNPDSTEPDGGDKPGDNPDGGKEPTGRTPDSTVTVYTTSLKLTKISGDDSPKVLTGAKFKIEGKAVPVYKISGVVYQESADGTYYRLKDGTYTETAPSTENDPAYDGNAKYEIVEVDETLADEPIGVTNEGWVNADGVLTFDNLGEGIYTITELIAPAGYNLLKEPITVTIEWNGAAKPEGATDWAMWSVAVNTKTVDGKDKEIPVSAANNMFSINVVNQAGVQLPSTGGMGTTIFYIVGGLMVLAAVVLLVTKRRMNNAA